MRQAPDRPLLRRGFPACLLLLALVAGGCAHVPAPSPSQHLGESGSAGRCAELFADLDRAAREAGVRDAGAFRIQGYPYLRTSRFLASFRGEIENPEMFVAWLDRLQDLDRRARGHEIENLPAPELAGLRAGDRSALERRVAECGDVLRERDCARARGRNEIRQRIRAPDEYILARRVLGLYSLTRFFVLQGVENWREEASETYSPERPPENARTRYGPGFDKQAASPRVLVQGAPRDALGIPAYSPRAMKALFQHYAPIWEVETASRADRIGAPVLEDENGIRIETLRPVTYTRLSLTRFGDAVLTQLNYIVWFPARPQTGILDLYGGFLDGLNFRVTLDTDGRPLLYETIHNCGCYHRLFPTDRLRRRGDAENGERPLVLPTPDMDHAAMRPVVSLANSTHYVKHLYGAPRENAAADKAYALTPYDELRSLPAPNGASRSLFLENSLVPGTDRLERVLLWPTGVLSPGAMRQWGRQAVALVGKRHFDDPRLMERIFRRAERER